MIDILESEIIKLFAQSLILGIQKVILAYASPIKSGSVGKLSFQL